MGRHKLPAAVRELHGTAHRNTHRDNADAPVPTRGIGPPPNHLTAVEAMVWDEVVAIAHPGVLGESDRVSFEVLVKLLVDFRYSEFPMPAAQLSQFVGLLGRYGMTPSDRQKIKAPKDKGASKFGRFTS